jgi:hypothetical protein
MSSKTSRRRSNSIAARSLIITRLDLLNQIFDCILLIRSASDSCNVTYREWATDNPQYHTKQHLLLLDPSKTVEVNMISST